MEAGIPARLTAREGRAFAFPVGAAFAVLAAIAVWRQHPVSFRVLAGISAALLVAGALVPDRLGPVYRGWMRFAHLLSRVTTPLFMGIVFFLVVTPIGLLMRLVGRQPLRHRERQGGFWMEPPSGGRSDLNHQF